MLLAMRCSGVSVNTRSPQLGMMTYGKRNSVTPRMGSRKPFKGGRLDDFLAAEEAEAKYGPRRYAAVSEDAWKIAREQRELDMNREMSLEVKLRPRDPSLFFVKSDMP